MKICNDHIQKYYIKYYRCNESTFLTTRQELEDHETLYHSNLHMFYKPVRRVYICQRCDNFESSSLKNMQEHANTHVNKFKCCQCPLMFMDFNSINAHFKVEHPSSKAEILLLSSDDLIKEADKIVGESIKYIDVEFVPQKIDPLKACEIPSQGYSYYGEPVTPLDLSSFRTQVVFAGLNMKRVAYVKCDKLAKILDINLEPTLILKDCMKEINNKDRVIENEMNVIENEKNNCAKEVSVECLGYSFYGQPVDPVNLRDFNTRMILSGMKKDQIINVDCARFAKIFKINFEPILEIRDFMIKKQQLPEIESPVISEEKESEEKEDYISEKLKTLEIEDSTKEIEYNVEEIETNECL